MDFDALLSLASKNQQDKLGVRRPVAISTSLPAPKRLERKQVDSSAIRKLLDDKKARSVDESAARNLPTAVSSSSTSISLKEKLHLPTAQSSAPGSAAGQFNGGGGSRPKPHPSRHDGQSGAPAGGTGTKAATNGAGKESSSNRGSCSSTPRGPAAAGSPASAGPADQPGAGKAKHAVATAPAVGSRLTRESAQSRAQSKGPSSGKDSAAAAAAGKSKAPVPPKPLNYAELLALAAAKAADPAATAANAAVAPSMASGTTTTADRLSKSRDRLHHEQKAGMKPVTPSGNAKRPTSPTSKDTTQSPRPAFNDSGTDVSLQRQQRKRRSKLPPELEDILGVRNPGLSGTDLGASTSRPGDPSGSTTATVGDPKSATADGRPKKPESAGQGRQTPKDKSGRQAATAAAAAATQQQSLKPRGVPKAQLAVAVMQKKREAAAAAARTSQPERPPAVAKAGRPQSETSISRVNSGSSRPATQVAARSQQLPPSRSAAAEARSGRAPAASGKSTAPQNDASQSVWDRIVNKAGATSKPKEPRKRRVLESDDDEYDEDMDDFIDDGDVYAPGGDISAEIKKIFGYDRSKFVDDDDDDIAMEARFADVMKEEARSARLGRLEDLEDMRKEEEYKKAKRQKKL